MSYLIQAIKWCSDTNGIGFITPEGGCEGDLFVYQSARTQVQTKHTCHHFTVLVQDDNWIIMQRFQKFDLWETQLVVHEFF